MDFKAILVATDFSECAGAAFKTAKKPGPVFRGQNGSPARHPADDCGPKWPNT